jgi:integrase
MLVRDLEEAQRCPLGLSGALPRRALPGADPRLRLPVELAAELRAGQAVRARRSDLDLESVGGFGLGRFVVHGNGKKHGEVVDLHPELRALVDETLATGYLSDAEIAYRWEEIPDYYLFPAGRLRRGKVRVDLAKAGHLGPTAIRDMFRALEKLAGVEHQTGRSLYGLRRQATDLAPEFAQDARVLNRLSGHLDSSTRERMYQDPMNELVLARGAKARQQMREYGRGGNGNGKSKPPEADLSRTYPRVIPPPPGKRKAPTA